MILSKRAAFCAALFFSSSIALAQVKNNKSETYKDIIEKAYNLSLQKDRQQAMSILTAAIRRETRPTAVSDLKRTLEEVSNIFFSDKAQQLYEVAISLRRTDLAQAQSKVTEAARIEPDNTAIVNELARLQIAKGDCSAAQDSLSKQMKLSPYDELLKISFAHSLLCQSQLPELAKMMDPKEIARSANQKFWLAIEAEKYLKEGHLSKAQDSVNSLKKVDSKYPELSYWIWRVDTALKKPQTEAAQKYVMTCKNISASQYRQYMIDPMLCRRVSDVENELKGQNGTVE